MRTDTLFHVVQEPVGGKLRPAYYDIQIAIAIHIREGDVVAAVVLQEREPLPIGRGETEVVGLMRRRKPG
jgi:hypothetical protein